MCYEPHGGVPFRRQCKRRRYAVDITLASRNMPRFRIAQARSRSDQRVEHWLEVKSGTADGLEHIARRGLVFERLFEIMRAGLQFAKQPRVLHRDDRLIGKGAHQLDLPLGERLDPPRLRLIVPSTAPSRSSGTPSIVR